MLIDCDSCAVRGVACDGCLVTALLEAPDLGADLTGAEHRAVEVFARAGFEPKVLSVTAPARKVRSRVPARAAPRVA